MKKVLKRDPVDQMPDSVATSNPGEYPSYPVSEDIYNKYKKEEDIDPEDVSRTKETDNSDNAPTSIGEHSTDDVFGRNLDVPGSELDDEREDVGNEDEENNYYSIGGDNHNNLDEDKDELL